jgi:hypothetical protein
MKNLEGGKAGGRDFLNEDDPASSLAARNFADREFVMNLRTANCGNFMLTTASTYRQVAGPLRREFRAGFRSFDHAAAMLKPRTQTRENQTIADDRYIPSQVPTYRRVNLAHNADRGNTDEGGAQLALRAASPISVSL